MISQEVHILNDFKRDFYNEDMAVVVAGYLRPEQNYESVEDLVKDIHIDIQITVKNCELPQYLKLKTLLL